MSAPFPGVPVVLALDLGTTTGWALQAADGLITSGTVSFRPSRYDGGGMRYLRFRGWLEQLAHDAGAITAIHFEEVRRHVGTDAAHVYGGLLATLTSWAETAGVAYVGVGTWTKIGLNNTDTNDQGAFDAANNHFVAPVDGTYLFGATLLYKINASATARMRGRLVLNGATEIRGSLGEISATHVSLATAIWLQTMVPLTAGDTVELQGYFRVADGYFAADHTSFWGCKIG